MTAEIKESQNKTLQARTYELVKWLMLEENEQAISLLEKLRKAQRIRTYEDSLKPMTKGELIARARASEEDIKNGDVISIEDLEKEMENW